MWFNFLVDHPPPGLPGAGTEKASDVERSGLNNPGDVLSYGTKFASDVVVWGIFYMVMASPWPGEGSVDQIIEPHITMSGQKN